MTDQPLSTDPAIKGGEPCITGTRIPMRVIQSYFDNGYSNEAIIEEYPTLSAEILDALRTPSAQPYSADDLADMSASQLADELEGNLPAREDDPHWNSPTVQLMAEAVHLLRWGKLYRDVQ